MKVTSKLLSAYKRAKTNWLSANENYNRDVYGITTAEYKLIKQAEYNLNGICNLKPLTVSAINKELEGVL